MNAALNLTFTDSRIPGCAQRVSVEFDRYRDGDGIVIELVCAAGSEDAGQPWTTASVNLPGCVIPADCVAIKDYSENDGIPSLLMANGLIHGAPVQLISSGHADIPVYRLTPAALEAANAALGEKYPAAPSQTA